MDILGLYLQILVPVSYGNLLLDAKTGKIINDNITWPGYGAYLASPVLYYDGDDQPFLIYNNETYVTCYALNENGFEEWNVLWTKPMSGAGCEYQRNLLTINDLVYVPNTKVIDVYNVTSGDLLDSVAYPTHAYSISDTFMIAGKDVENNVCLIMVTDEFIAAFV